MSTVLSILAQSSTPGGASPTGGAPGANLIMAIIMGMTIFMVLSQFSKSRRERKERDGLHASLAKNVRVMTIGGIYGTVVTVRENDVVLKVDESSNTKMTFRKSAIQQMVEEGR